MHIYLLCVPSLYNHLFTFYVELGFRMDLRYLYPLYTHSFNHSPPYRPENFKSAMVDDSNESTASQQENELEESDDDGLPPLEANTNRVRPIELQTDEDSESSSETDD